MSGSDTIASIATPPGFGGVGIVRVSGPGVRAIAEGILRTLPSPRLAGYHRFRDAAGETLDSGIALFFPSPHSFTGEDVLELQGHGGPLVLDLLLRRALQLGARPARPGEFSERAFLNGKLDLVQAEAVADLIASTTETAVRLAGQTLQGEFSRRVEALVEALIRLRTYVEAAIDFPDEEIDFFADDLVRSDLCSIHHQLNTVQCAAEQGRLVREGIRVVIAGPPNAGKSSLLNALAGSDRAIVTEVPGTTRDVLREEIQIAGLPLHVIDTAGLRGSDDRVEREGIRRARAEIDQADRLLWVFDDREPLDLSELEATGTLSRLPLTLVRNKIDLTGTPVGTRVNAIATEVCLSARTGSGLDLLKNHLQEAVGYVPRSEGLFMARRRHLDALEGAQRQLLAAQSLFETEPPPASELIAEHLRLAQRLLGEITGVFTSDDLLGRIFGSFCIGK